MMVICYLKVSKLRYTDKTNYQGPNTIIKLRSLPISLRTGLYVNGNELICVALLMVAIYMERFANTRV